MQLNLVDAINNYNTMYGKPLMRHSSIDLIRNRLKGESDESSEKKEK
jgi:hypothetical protein